MEPTVQLTLDEPGSDPARLDLLARQLRDELRQLDSAELRPGPATAAPADARGVDASAISTIVVAVLGSGGLTALVTAARAWLDRGRDAPRSLRLELAGDVLELSGASAHEQDRLVSAFLARHEVVGGPA